MNEFASQDGTIDIDAMWRVLQELEAGTLEPDRRDALMAFVYGSPAAQRAYLEYFEQAAMLQGEAAILSEEGKLPVVAESGFLARSFRRSVLAAAAVVVLGAIVAALIMVKPSEPGELSLVATADTRWTIDGAVQDPGADEWMVAEGTALQVWSGTVKLRFDSGSAMVVQGPARVSFPAYHQPVLESGWLWIDSVQPDEQFEIDTPDLVVRDIGTRFGVYVPAHGATEVHLIEGEVEVFAKSTGEKVVTLQPGDRGFGIPAAGEPAGLPLARDPFPDIAELLAAPSSYPGTVRSQNPAGYWRMDDAASGALANEIPGGIVGRHHRSVAMVASGPAVGSRGFDQDNRAVFLPGEPGGVPLSLGATPIHTGILFREDFSGRGALSGATPDVSIGDAKWIAASNFSRDGAFQPASASATLPFRPVDGVVYTLDASVRGVSGADDWIGLGFATGQSSSTGDARFITGNVIGRAWMLLKGNATGVQTHAGTNKNSAFLGTTGNDGGIADRLVYSHHAVGSFPDMDLRIVLDTSGGAWTATWYARRPSDPGYVVVRETTPLLNESITSVGLATSGPDISGTIEAFSLRADRKTPDGLASSVADGPARVARKAGALSFWMRREPGGERKEVFWTAGEHSKDESIQARLTTDGLVSFFMENGRYDVLITSSEPVVDGHWHHVAASWSPTAVELYLDGNLVASDTEFRGMLQGILPELRFGAAASVSDSAAFTGWLDEIALWDRALTPAEVRLQFRSATGER